MTYLSTINQRRCITRFFPWIITLLILFATNLLAADTAPAPSDPVKAWNFVPEKSRLAFTGDYGGSSFDGEFGTFSAIIQFDPAVPETGHFDVTVDITSVTTYNDDWDQVISERDWFDSKNHPVSKYVTNSIKPLDNGGFSALGVLDLKGRKHDVELRYHWTEYPDGEVKIAGQARMLGAANVNRTDFGIGEGSWTKDSTVGFDVMVNVDLLLQPAME